MYLIAGTHYGPERVTRLSNEKYHPDCVNEERPGQTRIMFWGLIIYGVPCAECPFFVWEEETEEEKEIARDKLAEENRIAEEAAHQINPNWYAEEIARRRTLPKGQRPRGRPKNPYKIQKKARGKKLKGGIDWFRYRENICEKELYPFYRKMETSAEAGERGRIYLIEDGAGPHRAKHLNNHHQINGINKIDWPAASPDLNPIERVWDYIRGKIASRRPFPTTKEATEKAWVEEWKAIPMEVTNSFIETLPQNMKKVYSQNGGNLYHG